MSRGPRPTRPCSRRALPSSSPGGSPSGEPCAAASRPRCGRVRWACGWPSAGRLGGSEMGRREWYREGRVPLHTLRAKVDFGTAEAKTTFGVCGVKVWVYHGDEVPRREQDTERALARAHASAQKVDAGNRGGGAARRGHRRGPGGREDRRTAASSQPHRKRTDRRRRSRRRSIRRWKPPPRATAGWNRGGQRLMLAPKKVKHRKVHRGHRRGMAKGGTEIHFGDYGLVALEPAWITEPPDRVGPCRDHPAHPPRWEGVDQHLPGQVGHQEAG